MANITYKNFKNLVKVVENRKIKKKYHNRTNEMSLKDISNTNILNYRKIAKNKNVTKGQEIKYFRT